MLGLGLWFVGTLGFVGYELLWKLWCVSYVGYFGWVQVGRLDCVYLAAICGFDGGFWG